MAVLQNSMELESLLLQIQRPLYAFILAQVRDREDADEVYQQTATVICEHFESYDPSRPFFPWACGVAWRNVLSHHRNASRLKLLADDKLGSALAERVSASIARVDPRLDELRDCLASLKPESREMVRQHYYAGAEVKQIAKGMAVSERCIQKTLAKIRRVLLDCIERKLREDC